LHVPDAWDYSGEGEGPGDIGFLGTFALVQGTTQPTASGGFTTTTYLERCGTQLHTTLPWAGRFGTTGSAHAIMLASGSSNEADPYGILLPSLQPFSVAVGSFLATTSFPEQNNNAEPYELFLTARRMYLMAPYPPLGCGNHPDYPCPPTPAQLWYAPTPKPSPKR
jgi:hypothetical protein